MLLRNLFLFVSIMPVVALADDCAPGYHLEETINVNTFVTTFGGNCLENSGMTGVQIYYPIAYPLNDVIRCDVGQHYENGACVNNAQGPCESGYGDGYTNGNETFISTLAGGCVSGYQPQITRNVISYVIMKPTPKCGFGFYPTPDGCVATESSNCPDGYYGVAPTDLFSVNNADRTCQENYEIYDPDTALCRLYLGGNTADLCTPLCNPTYNHTRADTCARKCATENMNELHIKRPDGTEYAWQLWMDKTTTPSLNIKHVGGNDICYVNLVDGNADGTINFRTHEAESYHAVDLKE